MLEISHVLIILMRKSLKSMEITLLKSYEISHILILVIWKSLKIDGNYWTKIV